MGIWLFDEKERHLALQVLQKLLVDHDRTEDGEDEENEEVGAQLKKISVTDLFGKRGKTPPPPPHSENQTSPSIMDLLSKAKVKHPPPDLPSQPQVFASSNSLDVVIIENFSHLPASTSLKSFTTSVAQFLQSNPQLLAGLHRKCIEKDASK